MLKRAFQNSLLVLAAYDEERLLGIIRVVGDGASIVWIQDILVFPEYQRQGVGTMLMRAIMDRYPGVYQMELATDNTPKTAAFYKSLGFMPLADIGCCAFMKMN